MRTQGPDQADLDKVKTNWLQTYRKSLQENGYWLAALQTLLTEGTDPATILTFDQEVQRRYPQAYADAAAIQLDIAPASVMPSSRICPCVDSAYDSSRSWSTGWYF